MIREKRNKEKLTAYYNKFMDEGILDPNVHPWVAESWQRCRNMRIPHETMPKMNRLTNEQLIEHQKEHIQVVEYVDGLYEQNKQHFNTHNLSMLLIDENGYVIKNYAMPFFQRAIDDIQGIRVLESDVGTSSISVAREHNVPFLMFGPEMWIRESHNGDACSAPICVQGKIRYILSFCSVDQNELPYDLLLSLLLTMKYSVERYLEMLISQSVQRMVLDEMPVSVFWLNRDEKIQYCNENGRRRLDGKTSLADVFLNYEHIPVRRALSGKPSYRREITWITQERTYEDVTTTLPVRIGDSVDGAVILSMSIEDLKTTIAHATGYSSRYSLYSMVGDTAEFLSLQHKATRIARLDNNILLQGEPGTGKQRLAHGIHQASPRAAAPLIVVKCSDESVDTMEEEFFGRTDGDGLPCAGKLELAMGGTLFIDEVEKMPVELGDRVADALQNGLPVRGSAERKKLNIRVIAACDSSLKRLADKGLFSHSLFDLVLGTVVRIPPLRERVKDIAVLTNHILAEMSAQYNVPQKRLTPDALQVLTGYSWPGNIKQLQGVIERAFFHVPGSIIEEEDIKMPVDRTMERSWKYDKDSFISVWKAAGGNISRLATMLDVSRVTLYRYLKKYELGPEQGREKKGK